MKIGVQTYTIRNLANKDLSRALKELKAIGVNFAEIARIDFSLENAEIIKNSNISVTSIQVKLKHLIRDFDQIIAFCKKTNCKVVVVSVLSLKAIIGKKKALLNFCQKLNSTGILYNQQGITFAFHHHNFEFVKLRGQTKLDIILRNTFDYVKIVTDTYWAKKSGVEPADLIGRLGDRLIGVHLRDYQEIKKGKKMKTKDAEIGSGLIDFCRVIEKAMPYASYAAIEQNTKTPMESIKKSVEYLKNQHYQNYF